MTRFLPGLAVLSRYDRSWLRYDLVAGVSVAAVAVPIAIAYSQLAGVPPAHGLYASILPLVAYALLGSSRQLIMAPDAATCAIVAATVAPLAAQDPGRYVSLTMALAMITGVFCIVAGIAGLGFLTNFLARPILTGYLNGIALSIISGQLGRLFGFSLEPAGFFRLVAAFISSVGRTHVLTLALGLGTFVLLRILKRVAPKVPGPLVAVAVGIGASSLFRFGDHSVALLGAIPAGLPAPMIPDVGLGDLGPLALGAVGLALISFNSAMVTARSFAVKNRYEIDSNQEFIALGAADIGAGLLQGFRRQRRGLADGGQRFSGRQEPGDRAGGSRPAGPGAAVPHRSAGAPAHYRAGRRADQRRPRPLRSAEPFQAPSGQSARVPLVSGHAAGRDHCRRAAGDASLVFFNADYFKSRVRAAVDASPAKVRCVLLDAETIPYVDTTGAASLEEVNRELVDRGIELAIASAKAPVRLMLDRTGLTQQMGDGRLFPTLESAVESVHSGML